MCGISAIISFEDSDIISNVFKMTDIIRHRGPDDEGFAVFGSNPSDIKIYGGNDTPDTVYSCGLNFTPKQKHPSEIHGRIALGHRRLSIIDISPRGHQPMSYKNGRYWITYNGEIYNYIEIRDELRKKRHEFVSNTDTEVILAAYDEWGEDCLHHFNGMWAFVIYDLEKGKVFFARDRFGVKPLFYWKLPDEKTYAVSSEIKQFTAFDIWNPEVNPPRLHDFLRYGVRNHTKGTLFKGVNELKGGWKIIFDMVNCRANESVWYDLGTNIKNEKLDFDSACLKFKYLFKEAVSLRLRSDVKVGSCLSGGLDSSSIVCSANFALRQKNKGFEQETVSACYSDKSCDEEVYFKEAVDKFNLVNHKVFPDAEFLIDNINKIMWDHDEPIPSTGAYAQWKVFEEAKKHNLTVMLDGQGGDELMAGYHLYFDSYFIYLLRNFKLSTLLMEIYGFKRMHNYGMIDCIKFLGKGFLGKNTQLLARRLLKRNQYHWFNWKADDEPLNYLKPGITAMSISQIKDTNLPMLLHFEDRNSMAFSIESRTPFLDYRLVEFIISLPDNYKINKGQTKYILRKGMKGTVPDKILGRQDKVGFATPEVKWFSEKPEGFLENLLDALDIFEKMIDRKQIIDAYKIDSANNNFRMGSVYWRLISAGIWAKIFKIKL